MKKVIATIAASLLTLTLVTAGQPNAADQKWLEVVGKKVTAGEAQVSTPSETRVELAKQWAGQNGYSVDVAKKESNFQITFSKQVASK